jgi:hypothetical protein
MNRYTVIPSRFWQKKAGYNGPERVSIYGSLPMPREAYEMVEKGFAIYNLTDNTISNYFFGKIGIDTEEEANQIINRLTNR